MLFFGKTRHKNIDDETLIRDYRESGQNRIVGELFERYAHLVYGVCLKYLKNKDESKDAVLAIFENLLTGLKENEITNFKSWLYTVSKNHCLMHLRQQTRDDQRLMTMHEENKELQKEPDDHELTEKQLAQLDKAMNELKEEQRICVDLFYKQEKCYNEIAELTGYTLNQVKSYIQNGKRNLKIILTSGHGIFTKT
jgi:RNA polymerase sigma factor (sigma-70 family)